MVTDVASTPMAGAATMPDAHGRFGRFGGLRAQTLMSTLRELEEAYAAARKDPSFQARSPTGEYYVGRPTPVYYAENLSRSSAAPRSTSSRGFSPTPARTRSTIAWQALLANACASGESSPRPRGQSTGCIGHCLALLDMDYCLMGRLIWRQSLNVFRNELLGSEVRRYSGSKTLKDAINEAIRDWSRTSNDLLSLRHPAGMPPYR